jgi:hypothetical protein
MLCETQAHGHAARRDRGLAETLGQFGLDGLFHVAGQLAHDVVEQAHLDLAVVLAGEEQVSDPAQKFAALGAGRLVGQGDQVVKAGLHQFSPLFLASSRSGGVHRRLGQPFGRAVTRLLILLGRLGLVGGGDEDHAARLNGRNGVGGHAVLAADRIGARALDLTLQLGR